MSGAEYTLVCPNNSAHLFYICWWSDLLLCLVTSYVGVSLVSCSMAVMAVFSSSCRVWTWCAIPVCVCERERRGRGSECGGGMCEMCKMHIGMLCAWGELCVM